VRRLVVLAIVTLAFAGNAVAAPSCGRWISNTNGTSWRMCTDSGQRYCERQKGREIKRIVCP